jgi:hypothetical protein
MKITESRIRGIIKEELHRSLFCEQQEIEKIEMPAVLVTGTIPEPVNTGDFSLDVSMVGNRFVHIGKLSDLDAIVDRFGPENGQSNSAVVSSIRQWVGKEFDVKFFVPVGVGARFLPGVSAGTDDEGNSIPIILYDDMGFAATGSSQLVRDDVTGVGGTMHRGTGKYLYGLPSSQRHMWDPDLREDVPDPLPAGVLRYWSINNEGFSSWQNHYDLRTGAIVDYPFEGIDSVGQEASDNYFGKPWDQPTEEIEVLTAIDQAPDEDALASVERDIELEDPPIRDAEGEPALGLAWCDQFPDHPRCKDQR